MTTLIIIIHLIVCFALILIVLLQTGKGASMGAMFGSAGNQTLFGNTGATTFLTKATTAAAVIFMLTSLSLAYFTKGGDNSVVTDYKPKPVETAPVTDTLPQPEAKIPVAEVPAAGQEEKAGTDNPVKAPASGSGNLPKVNDQPVADHASTLPAGAEGNAEGNKDTASQPAQPAGNPVDATNQNVNEQPEQ